MSVSKLTGLLIRRSMVAEGISSCWQVKKYTCATFRNEFYPKIIISWLTIPHLPYHQRARRSNIIISQVSEFLIRIIIEKASSQALRRQEREGGRNRQWHLSSKKRSELLFHSIFPQKKLNILNHPNLWEIKSWPTFETFRSATWPPSLSPPHSPSSSFTHQGRIFQIDKYTLQNRFHPGYWRACTRRWMFKLRWLARRRRWTISPSGSSTASSWWTSSSSSTPPPTFSSTSLPETHSETR